MGPGIEQGGLAVAIGERALTATEVIYDGAKSFVREHVGPGATDAAVVEGAGNLFVQATEYDVATVGATSAEVRDAIVTEDVAPALLAGIEEDAMGVPLPDNAITRLEEYGNSGLITEAVARTAQESPEDASQAARLVDAATDLLTGAESGTNSIGEIQTRCEQRFTAELGSSLRELLANIPTDEQELIISDPALRNQVARALEAYGVEDQLGVGSYVPGPEYVGNPDTMDAAAVLVAGANRVDEPFQASMSEVAKQVGGEHARGPVKTKARVAEKADHDYLGDVSEVKDAVRCRIGIPGDPTTQDGTVIQLLRDSGLRIAFDSVSGRERIKRGFIAKDGQPLPVEQRNRYMDTKVTLELPDPEGGTPVYAEVAITTPEMAAATKVEHSMYEIIRSIGPGSGSDQPVRLRLKSRLAANSEKFFQSVSAGLAQRVRSTESVV